MGQGFSCLGQPGWPHTGREGPSRLGACGPAAQGLGRSFFSAPHPSPSQTLQYFVVSLQCPFRKAAGRGKEGMKEEKQTNKGQRARRDSVYVECNQEKLPLTSGGQKQARQGLSRDVQGEFPFNPPPSLLPSGSSGDGDYHIPAPAMGIPCRGWRHLSGGMFQLFALCHTLVPQPWG